MSENPTKYDFADARPMAVERAFNRNGDLVKRWLPRLAGRYVKCDGEPHDFATKGEAVASAARFRDLCLASIKNDTAKAEAR